MSTLRGLMLGFKEIACVKELGPQWVSRQGYFSFYWCRIISSFSAISSSSTQHLRSPCEFLAYDLSLHPVPHIGLREAYVSNSYAIWTFRFPHIITSGVLSSISSLPHIPMIILRSLPEASNSGSHIIHSFPLSVCQLTGRTFTKPNRTYII